VFCRSRPSTQWPLLARHDLNRPLSRWRSGQPCRRGLRGRTNGGLWRNGLRSPPQRAPAGRAASSNGSAPLNRFPSGASPWLSPGCCPSPGGSRGSPQPMPLFRRVRIEVSFTGFPPPFSPSSMIVQYRLGQRDPLAAWRSDPGPASAGVRSSPWTTASTNPCSPRTLSHASWFCGRLPRPPTGPFLPARSPSMFWIFPNCLAPGTPGISGVASLPSTPWI